LGQISLPTLCSLPKDGLVFLDVAARQYGYGSAQTPAPSAPPCSLIDRLKGSSAGRHYPGKEQPCDSPSLPSPC
jgi:hypothetical protein